MVKKRTKLRRKIKQLIKETTGKEYSKLKDVFGFSIKNIYYPGGSKDTFEWHKSGSRILRYFHKNGYARETAFNFLTRVKELCDKYDVIKGNNVLIDPWKKENTGNAKSIMDKNYLQGL